MEDSEEISQEYCNLTGTAHACNMTDGGTMQLEEFRPETYAVPITLALILIIGVCGNVLLLIFLGKNNRLSSPYCILLTSLAISDLIMLVVSMPLVSTLYTIKSWPFGNIGCKLSEFAQSLSVASAIFNITMLSVDRFLTFVIRDVSFHRRLACGAVVGVWIAAFLIALPDVISSTTLNFGDLEFCILYPNSFGEMYPKAHVAVRFCLLFVLPLLLIATFYTLLIILIGFSGGRSPTTESSSILAKKLTPSTLPLTDKETNRRRRLMLVVMGFVIAFVLCWLPRHIYLIWFHFDSSEFNLFWHAFKIVGFCLMFLNSAVNPIIYAVLDRKFRVFVKGCLCCRLSELRQESEGYERPSSNSNQTMALTVFTQNASESEPV